MRDNLIFIGVTTAFFAVAWAKRPGRDRLQGTRAVAHPSVRSDRPALRTRVKQLRAEFC